MEETSRYLFVYGSLLDPSNQFALFLRKHCSFFGDAKLRGKLYHIGPYPGAIHIPGSKTFIHGKVFMIDDRGSVLPILDTYEGFGESEIQPNEFIRKLVGVETEKDLLKCWVYLYNWPVEGLKVISSGDYLTYRK